MKRFEDHNDEDEDYVPPLIDIYGRRVARCADCKSLVHGQVLQSNHDGRVLCEHDWNKEQFEWAEARRRGHR